MARPRIFKASTREAVVTWSWFRTDVQTSAARAALALRTATEHPSLASDGPGLAALQARTRDAVMPLRQNMTIPVVELKRRTATGDKIRPKRSYEFYPIRRFAAPTTGGTCASWANHHPQIHDISADVNLR